MRRFLTIFLLLIPFFSFSQVIQQLGEDIDGQSLFDVFGYATAISGDGTIVASSSWAFNHPDSLAVLTGNVRVYEWDGSSWNQLGGDIYGEADGDRFGIDLDLSLDGHTLIVGADQHSSNGTEAGQVKVFEWNGADWIQKGTSFYGDDIFYWLGAAVTISHSGDTIAMGMPGFDIPGDIPQNDMDDMGLVRCFRWNGSAWMQLGEEIIGEMDWDQDDMEFGRSLELSGPGNHLIVGAPLYRDALDFATRGEAKVFQFNDGAWDQIGSSIRGFVGGQRLGQRGELDITDAGNRIVVGSTYSGSSRVGNVLTYDWDGSDWQQVGDTLTGDFNYDKLGTVSMTGDGNKLLVGAPGTPSLSIGSGGFARLYEWDGANWVQFGEDIIGEDNGDEFGTSVALSESNIFVIGGPENNDFADRAGHIRMFEHCIPANVVDEIEACNSYTWIDGITYSSSNDEATYSVPGPTCDTIYQLQLTIYDSPDLSIAGLSDSYTLYDEPVELTGTPEGGSFSGSGITGNTFNPSDAGVGSQSITYAYTSNQGCSNSISQLVEVTDTVSFQFDLMITGVYDGPLSGGLPKGVELFVGNNIEDLSIYGLGSANNGGGSDGQEYTLPAISAEAGSFIYIASELSSFEAFMGFTALDATDAMAINGDDAVELFQNGTAIDVYGEVDNSGNGEVWQYTDGWAFRKECATPNDGNFDPINWIFSGPDALDNETSNSTASMPIPVGSFQCDSIVIECQTTFATDIESACDEFTWIDGNTYTNSNNSATFVLTNAAGCDSVITLDLSITTINTSVAQDGSLLVAEEEGATYQWIDCDGSSPIEGATEQSFTAEMDGDYAVMISANGCSETSECYTVLTTGVEHHAFGNNLKVYPNPTSGNVIIELNRPVDMVETTVSELSGRVIKTERHFGSGPFLLNFDTAPGVYLLQIRSQNELAVVRLMKD